MVNFNSIGYDNHNINIDNNRINISTNKKNVHELSISEIHEAKQGLEKQKMAIEAYKKTCNSIKTHKLLKKQNHISYKA